MHHAEKCHEAAAPTPAHPLIASSRCARRSTPSVDRRALAWSQLPRLKADALDVTQHIPGGLVSLTHPAPRKGVIQNAGYHLLNALKSGLVSRDALTQALQTNAPHYLHEVTRLAAQAESDLHDRYIEHLLDSQSSFDGIAEAWNFFHLDLGSARTSDYDSDIHEEICLSMDSGCMIDLSTLQAEPPSVIKLVRTALWLYHPLCPHMGAGEIWQWINGVAGVGGFKREEAEHILSLEGAKLQEVWEREGFFCFHGDEAEFSQDLARDYLQSLETEAPTWLVGHDEPLEDVSLDYARSLLDTCDQADPDNHWVRRARTLVEGFCHLFKDEQALAAYLHLLSDQMVENDGDEMSMCLGVYVWSGTTIEADYMEDTYREYGQNYEVPTLKIAWGDDPSKTVAMLDTLAEVYGLLLGMSNDILSLSETTS